MAALEFGADLSRRGEGADGGAPTWKEPSPLAPLLSTRSRLRLVCGARMKAAPSLTSSHS